MLKQLAKLALTVVLLLLVCGCNPRVRPPLRLGTIVWPGYEFFYLARTLDFYDGVSIQLVEYTSSSEVLTGFKNNTLEAIALTGDEFLRLAAEQPDVRAIAVLDISFGADGLIGQPGITNLAQLKGKKIGVEPNSVGTLLLMYALEKAGLGKDDIHLVHSQNAEQEEMFQSGSVDAVATFEPTKSRLLRSGANLLYDSQSAKGKIMDLLVVRQSLLEQQPARLERVLAAWFKARDFYLENQFKAAELMAPRENITPDEFIYAMEGLLIPSAAENKMLFTPGTNSLASRLEGMVTFLHRNGLLKQNFDAAALLSGSIVERLP